MWPRKCLCLFSVLLFLYGAAAWASTAPDIAQVKASYLSSEATLLDRHGEPLQQLRIDLTVRRLGWVELGDVSPALINAVLAAEDQRFYQHSGVDVQAIGKAAWDNLFNDHKRGASTITMQLAGMLDADLQLKNGSRTWSQKWQQIKQARELDEQWSKNQILEAYLNLVNFRGELQGINSASRMLFDKAPSGLDATESLILASLIRAPNASYQMVAKRACLLAKDNHLDATCNSIEVKTRVALNRKNGGQDLTGNASFAQSLAIKLLKQPAQRVTSSLDGKVQRFARDSLRQQLAGLGDRNVTDGAVLVIDNATGEVLAYVGNAGNTQVDGVVALRQAGSTLKPFLYELAIEKKYLTAASVLDDSPIDITTPSGLYVPQNYDNDFKGLVSVRTSLASSLNVPAVRTLLLMGVDDFYNRLGEIGISSLSEPADYYGYALALGSAEVSLWDLTNAYRVLANQGRYGKLSLSPNNPALQPTGQKIMDPGAAFIIQTILSDRSARSVTFGLVNDLATPYWSAVKTGTSKDMRDNWCVGFSGKYTVGVWVGNFDGQPMWDVSGVTGAAPVWRDIMDYLNSSSVAYKPKVPAGVVPQAINYVPAIESARNEWFLRGTQSAQISVVDDAHRAPKIVYPARDSIIAIDPDIPKQNQRVFFRAHGANDLTWRLDEKSLASAAQDYAWSPVAGSHRLELVNGDGNVVDTAQFQIRGTN